MSGSRSLNDEKMLKIRGNLLINYAKSYNMRLYEYYDEGHYEKLYIEQKGGQTLVRN
jgi:hypothetical protein